jgi:hypothetical protein
MDKKVIGISREEFDTIIQKGVPITTDSVFQLVQRNNELIAEYIDNLSNDKKDKKITTSSDSWTDVLVEESKK